MKIYTGKSLLIVPPDLPIFSDALKRPGVLRVKRLPRELMVFSGQSLYLRIDNMTVLSYLLNVGGTHNKHLIGISKEILDCLIEKKILLTAEYISSPSNQTADWESRNF